jgi:hypothetical protein
LLAAFVVCSYARVTASSAVSVPFLAFTAAPMATPTISLSGRYLYIGKAVNAEFATKMYEAAKETTGKDIARPDEK